MRCCASTLAVLLAACGSDDAAAPCAVSGAYEYWSAGGLSAWNDRAWLEGGTTYRMDRTYTVLSDGQPRPAASCTAALPACAATDTITAQDVEAAIRARAVQAALSMAEPPFFGIDYRGADGTAFTFRRVGDGRAFLVGDPCSGKSSADVRPCVEPPPAIARLRDLLGRLDQQQLATDACRAALPER